MRANTKVMPQQEKQIFYISVGAKEVLYTLRKMIIDRFGNSFDSYICNLSANKDEAFEKAKTYFNQINNHLSHQDINSVLSLEPEYNTTQYFKSRKALNDDRITQIENGITPIGSYSGFKITELPEHYILWLANQFTGQCIKASDQVFQTLASIALGLALERGLFEKKLEVKPKTCHLGEIGQRINFSAKITNYEVTISFYGNILNYTFEVNGKTVKYRGSKYIGVVGQCINLKATIDEHLTMQNGSEITFIKRPILV